MRPTRGRRERGCNPRSERGRSCDRDYVCRPAAFDSHQTAHVVGGIDDERERVVDGVDLLARRDEVETKMEAPVGKRRLGDLETEAEFAGRAQSELVERLRPRAEQEAGVVAQLP